jgi:hypothetical protein
MTETLVHFPTENPTSKGERRIHSTFLYRNRSVSRRTCVHDRLEEKQRISAVQARLFERGKVGEPRALVTKDLAYRLTARHLYKQARQLPSDRRTKARKQTESAARKLDYLPGTRALRLHSLGYSR